MAKMQEFADKMCACKDAKCAQDVSDEMTKWGQEMSKEMDEPPKMSEEDTEKAMNIGKRMGDCMVKAMGADLPQQDPPRPGDEPDHIDKGADTGTPLKEGDKTPDGKIIVK
jgi:hypothetical protein